VYDGYALDDSHERRRSMRACRAIERRYGLADASAPERRVSRTATLTRTEREMTQRVNAARGRDAAPVRLVLAEQVRTAVERAQGSPERFHALLEAAGVAWRRTAARNGRISGYTFGALGEVDAAGAQRWYRGSKLARDLAWAQLAPRLGEQAQAWRQPPAMARQPAGARAADAAMETRRVLAGKVLTALEAGGGDPRRFHAALDTAGVAWRRNVASTGRMAGYAFAEANDPEKAWYGGSKLHKTLAWSQLSDRLVGDRRAGPGPSGG